MYSNKEQSMQKLNIDEETAQEGLELGFPKFPLKKSAGNMAGKD